MTTMRAGVAGKRVVSREAWLAERVALLEAEKDHTRRGDALAARRMELPWVRVEKEYVFDTPAGRRTLKDLFDGRSQLIVYHFMFGPGWKEGCPSCSLIADHLDTSDQHLRHHDVTVAVVSRATLAEIEPFRRRMGWRFAWVSSHGGDFNRDHHVHFTAEERAAGKVGYNYGLIDSPVDDLHGVSVFALGEDGAVYHTYSAYARGCEPMLGVYALLDMAPLGRNEHGPHGNMGDWLRHRDRYEEPGKAGGICATGSCGCGGR